MHSLLYRFLYHKFCNYHFVLPHFKVSEYTNLCKLLEIKVVEKWVFLSALQFFFCRGKGRESLGMRLWVHSYVCIEGHCQFHLLIHLYMSAVARVCKCIMNQGYRLLNIETYMIDVNMTRSLLLISNIFYTDICDFALDFAWQSLHMYSICIANYQVQMLWIYA